MEQKVLRVMKSQLIKKIKDQKGFSLAELLMVIGLIFLIVFMISASYLQSINTNRDVINITKSEIDSRIAMYSIGKDIRESLDVMLADNSEIEISSNIDSDEEFETVRYYLAATDEEDFNLMKEVDGAAGRIIIMHIIDENLFSYYSGLDSPEGGMTEPVAEIDLNDIKLININIKVDQGGSQSLRTMELDTMISLRNKI